MGTNRIFIEAVNETILYVCVIGTRKRNLMAQIQKIEFFMLLVSYNSPLLSATILEGKIFDAQRNWQLNWAVFSKEIKPEIEKT